MRNGTPAQEQDRTGFSRRPTAVTWAQPSQKAQDTTTTNNIAPPRLLTSPTASPMSPTPPRSSTENTMAPGTSAPPHRTTRQQKGRTGFVRPAAVVTLGGEASPSTRINPAGGSRTTPPARYWPCGYGLPVRARDSDTGGAAAWLCPRKNNTVPVSAK